MNFLLGVLAGIIGEIICIIIIRLFKLQKKIFLILLKKLLSDEYFLFENQKTALKDIYMKYHTSCEVRVLSVRGLSYMDNSSDFGFIWESTDKRIEIILSDIDNSSISKRCGNSLFNTDEYKKEMELINACILKKSISYPHLSYYKHNQDLAFRLIVLDRYLYVSFFNYGVKAADSKMYRFERDSQAYKAFLKYYKDIRRSSQKSTSIYGA